MAKLNTNTCYVVFTKDNKSLASMICTLNHAVMPSTVVAYLNSGNLLQLIQSRLTVDTHHITAYNLEKGGWGNFYYKITPCYTLPQKARETVLHTRLQVFESHNLSPY